MRLALTNCRLFDGIQFHYNKAIVLENDYIHSITAPSTLPTDIPVLDLNGNYLVPSFIDLQINGGNGILFTKDITEASLKSIHEAHLEDGVTDWLPTLVSTKFEDMFTAIEVVRQTQGRYGVLGLHLEGPYMHPAKRGAHQEEFLRKPTDEELKRLVQASEGLLILLTIAPELFTDKQLAFLKESGWILSAGHSEATYAQATSAFAKGVTTVTHLYNAMSPLHHREPGLVGATLESATTWASIIVDGIHVDYAAIRIAHRLKPQRLFLISDAVFVRNPVEHFEFGAWTAHYENGSYVNREGRLAGSSITMLDGVRNCVQQVGIKLEEALRMASAYPAAVLGMDNTYGYIRPGYRGHLAVLDEALACKQVISPHAVDDGKINL